VFGPSVLRTRFGLKEAVVILMFGEKVTPPSVEEE
jgi:hypothetical protein